MHAHAVLPGRVQTTRWSPRSISAPAAAMAGGQQGTWGRWSLVTAAGAPTWQGSPHSTSAHQGRGSRSPLLTTAPPLEVSPTLSLSLVPVGPNSHQCKKNKLTQRLTQGTWCPGSAAVPLGHLRGLNLVPAAAPPPASPVLARVVWQGVRPQQWWAPQVCSVCLFVHTKIPGCLLGAWLVLCHTESAVQDRQSGAGA